MLGKVVAFHIQDDCVLDKDRCYIDTPKLDLIGRLHGGGWYSRVTDRFELPRISVEEWAKRKAAKERKQAEARKAREQQLKARHR